MFARNKNLSRLMTVLTIAGLLFGTTSCGAIRDMLGNIRLVATAEIKTESGLDPETLKVLADGIKELGNQPGRWQEAMSTVIEDLGRVGTQSAKKVLSEVEAVYKSMLAQSMGMLGTAAKCQTDFFGIRAQQKLQAILHKLVPQAEEPTIVPFICNFDPNEVHASKDLTKKTKIVHYYGFDFLDFENRYRADLQYDSGQIIQKGFGSVAVQSNYELTVEFQAATYGSIDFSKHPQLVLEWNEQQIGPPKMKSELAVVNVDPPEPPPVATVQGFLIPRATPTVPPPPGPAVNAPPGLVVGLRHNVYQKAEDVFKQSTELGFVGMGPLLRYEGGDLGMSSGEGFSWWMVPDNPGASWTQWKLPAGVVLGLKHSETQQGVNITLFGHDATIASTLAFPGYTRVDGGDEGGGTGEGYYWWESTGQVSTGGEQFNWKTDRAWADRLPRGTIIGLKHSMHNRNKLLHWDGQDYDPASDDIPPPEYEKKYAHDYHAYDPMGFYWYEKVTGMAVVLRSDTRAGELGSGLELNVDREQSDRMTFYLEGDEPRVCQAYCYGYPWCRAWTFYHPNIAGPKARCWLKDTVPAPTLNKPCCVAGVTVGQ
jgi:hypothetical protein